MQASTADELRASLRNKIVMEIYSAKDRKVVGIHVCFWTELNVHIGLVLVDKCAQGRGLQQVCAREKARTCSPTQ